MDPDNNHELPYQYWDEAPPHGSSSGVSSCCKSTIHHDYISFVERPQDSVISKRITTTNLPKSKDLATQSSIAQPNIKKHEEVTEHDILLGSDQQTDNIIHNTRRYAECAFARVKVSSLHLVEYALTGISAMACQGAPALAAQSFYTMLEVRVRYPWLAGTSRSLARPWCGLSSSTCVC